VSILRAVATGTYDAREARLRRLAIRRGLRVRKMNGLNGAGRPIGFIIIDPKVKGVVSGPIGMDLDQLEEWLKNT